MAINTISVNESKTNSFVVRNDEGVIVGYLNLFKNTNYGRFVEAELDADDILEIIERELKSSTIEHPIENSDKEIKDYRNK